jgi:hypothetical protein
MQLPPKSNHRITPAEAGLLTAQYRRHATIGAPKGGMFWKEPVEALLSQERCVALRFYYAEYDDGKPTLVFVGVDEQGKDILDGVMLDLVWPCPPFCDVPNVLNSNFEQRNPKNVSLLTEKALA